MKPRLNCIGPSPSDSRDFPPPSLTAHQKYVDYRRWNRIAENQGAMNSCTMNGWEGMIQVPVNKLRGIDMQDGINMIDLDAQTAYRQLCALYYNYRDNGAYARDTAKFMKEYGLDEISPVPGTVHKIREYWSNPSVDALRNSLLTTGPQTIATEWLNSFSGCRQTGGLIYLKPRDFRLGFHQTCCEGFIDKFDTEVFVVRNSHGMEFGDMGCFYATAETLSRIMTDSFGGLYDAPLEQLAELIEKLYMEAT
jgi:hypothetical protein